MKTKIGMVGVDSGQLMVCDPCYLRAEWAGNEFHSESSPFNPGPFEFSYDGACRATLRNEGHGQLVYKMGHAGAGVAIKTTHGDGCYPVYLVENDGHRSLVVELD